jgi:polyisoprenoid-binding protein YceI
MSWQLDSNHSEVQFKARHMMVSWVKGNFEKFSGTINLDDQNPENTTVNIQIDAASINTRMADRDAHLRSPDFLDAPNYPYLTFTSKRVQKTGANTAKLVGDLTIRDITKEVVLDVAYEGQRKSPFGPFVVAGFNASTVISRKEWNLTWNGLIEGGGVLVGDDVHINIEVELNKVAEAQAAAAVAAA